MKFTKKISDMYGEACFSQKMFTDEQNMDFPLWSWVENRVHGVETHTRLKKRSWRSVQ